MIFCIILMCLTFALTITAIIMFCMDSRQSRGSNLSELQSIAIPLRGVNLKNPDGVPIQEVIKMMEPGDTIHLRASTYKGRPSVRVDSFYGTIGFLPSCYANQISNLIDQMQIYKAEVENIVKSATGKSKCISIKVFLNKENVADPYKRMAFAATAAVSATQWIEANEPIVNETPKSKIGTASIGIGSIVAVLIVIISTIATNIDGSLITLSEFNDIQNGMTYEQVCEIIGDSGELLSEVDLGIGSEYATEIYVWEGHGGLGANANVTFQGGVVVSKAQIGLR